MRKSFILLSMAAFLFSACGNNQSKEQDHDATHQHDDGLVHQNHEATDSVKQEEFTATPDTTTQNQGPKHEHSHDGEQGHEHPHKH